VDFQAKELRLVIRGLKKLHDESKVKLAELDSESDEYVHEANDAVLVELMINTLEDEYRRKFAATPAP
jgi:hypothetical protein